MDNDDNIQSQWQQIIEQSDALLEMAKSAAWEQLSAAAETRDQLIKSFFNSHPADKSNAADFKKQIQQIIDIDNEIKIIEAHSRTELMKELESFRSGSKAVTAYQSCP